MALRLCLLIVCLCLAIGAEAARLLYQYPDAAKVKNTDRIYVFQNNSGERNLTGSQFRYEATGGDSALTKQAAVTNRYRRIVEYKNYSGQITSYITANGAMVVGSRTPQPLSVASITPASGFSGWSTSRSPYITFNKSDVESTFDRVNSYYKLPDGSFTLVGQSPVAVHMEELVNSFRLTNLTLTPNTTYTLRLYPQNIPQTDGETAYSCGIMTDMGGYCQSTFTTGSL